MSGQTDEHRPPPEVDLDQLLPEVRRKHREMESMLFWRDTREVGAACLTGAAFLSFAMRDGEWTFALAGCLCLGVGAVVLIDRRSQYRRRVSEEASVPEYLQSVLDQVNHQIWLLKNITWWYLLPLMTGLLATVSSIGWKFSQLELGLMANIYCALILAMIGVMAWGVYSLNQRGVREVFEPRRQEVETLLRCLQE